MNICCYCGLLVQPGHEICQHHLYSEDDQWHENNRVMCGVLNRSEPWPQRVSPEERETDFTEHFNALDESTVREAADSPLATVRPLCR